jgi:hypothetical protein
MTREPVDDEPVDLKQTRLYCAACGRWRPIVCRADVRLADLPCPACGGALTEYDD